MAGSVYKALMGKEDCDVQDDELYPSTFSRLNSTGSTISLTSFPDVWKTHQNAVNAKYYGDHTQVGATLTAAVGQTVNHTCKAIYIDAGEWVINTDYDWSSYTTVQWIFAAGAYLSISVGCTVTFPSPSHIIAAPSQQIFSGSGTVSFSSTGAAYSGWFATLEAFQESDAGHFIIEKAWELSAAVDFDQDDSVIEFVGAGKVSTDAATISGLTISGNNCRVIRPYMQGPGSYLQDTTDVAMIYVTGDNCHIDQAYIYDWAVKGITFSGVTGGKLTNSLFKGGVAAKTATGYQAVRLANGDEVQIDNVRIIPDGSNRTVQGIVLATGSDRVQMSNVYVLDPFDEGLYCASGNYGQFNNIFVELATGNTSEGGIKLTGVGLEAHGIKLIGDASSHRGLKLDDVSQSHISDVYIYGALQYGINWRWTTGTTDISDSTLKGVTVNTYGSADDHAGIRLVCSSNVDIEDIVISDFSVLNGDNTHAVYGISIGAGTKDLNRVKVLNGSIESVGGGGILIQSSGTSAKNVIHGVSIESPGMSAAAYGITVQGAGVHIYGNNLDIGAGDMAYGVHCNSATTPIDFRGGNVVTGATARPYYCASLATADIITDEHHVIIGDIASNATDTKPIMVAGGANGTMIQDCGITVSTGITAHAADYRNFDLQNGSTSMSDVDTASGGDNVSITADTPMWMHATHPPDADCDVARGTVVRMTFGGGGTEPAIDNCVLTIRYIDY